MRRTISSQRRTSELKAIAMEFHKRAFGEEMARVNFLPVGERKKISEPRSTKEWPRCQRKVNNASSLPSP